MESQREREVPRFVERGPTYELMARVGLAHPDAPHIILRIILAVAITWIPVVVLTLWRSTVLVDGSLVSLLEDLALHVRLLLALPLLIFAEVVIGPKLTAVSSYFTKAELVTPAQQGEFDSAGDSVRRLRDSRAAETLLLVLAFAGAWLHYRVFVMEGSASWQLSVHGGTRRLTAAGFWYLFVCVPFIQFVVYRWLWVGILWAKYLARVAGLDLRLTPTHPDGAGGLGFVGEGQRAFGLLLFALAAVDSAELCARVLFHGASATAFKVPVIGLIVLLVALSLLPLLAFTKKLSRIRFEGLLEYGALVSRHHQQFDDRWIQGKANKDQSLIGNPDVSSLADFGTSYDFVQKMRTIPFDTKTVIVLAASAAVPFVPLVATQVPLKDILKRVLGILA